MEQYVATALTCRYTIPEPLASPDAHQDLVDAIDSSVAQMVLDHPMLQVGQINEDSKRPAWIELESIDLRRHIEWKVVSRSKEFEPVFENILRTQVDTRFDNLDTTPGWRVAVVRQENRAFMDVILAWHHSHMDGTSAKILHGCLLRKLNSTMQNDKRPILTGRVLKLPGLTEDSIPPQEKLGKYAITARYAVSATWRSVLPKMLVPESPTRASWAPILRKWTKTHTRSFGVAHVVVQRVLAACREHKTTLTGLLHGAVLVSLAAQLSSEKAPGFSATTARDMRPYLPSEQPKYPGLDPKNTVGNIVTIVEHEFLPKNVEEVRASIRTAPVGSGRMDALATVLWVVAADARDDIRRDIKLGLKNNPTGLMALVPDWRPVEKAAADRQRPYSWLVTNLGVLDGAQDGGTSWGIQRGRFTLSANVTSPALQISAVSVKGHDLVVDVTWQDGAVDVEIGERVISDVEAWLRHLGK